MSRVEIPARDLSGADRMEGVVAFDPFESVERFVEEVLGNFSPWVYEASTRVLPTALPLLLNVSPSQEPDITEPHQRHTFTPKQVKHDRYTRRKTAEQERWCQKG